MAFGKVLVSLEQWIASAARDADAGPITAISCGHVVFDGNGAAQIGDEVIGKQFAMGRAWKEKDLAAEILGRCEAYSQALPGTQTYKLTAYYGDKQPGNFHHITCTGRTINPEGGTDDASPRGQMSQELRQRDGIVGRVFAMHDKLWAVTENLLTRYEGEARHYQGEFRAAESAVHQMLRERVTENNVHEMRVLEFTRSTAERQKLITLLPAMLRHITKDQNIVPADMADTAILESVSLAIRQMDPAQKQEVMTKLVGVSPELAMLLGGRLKEIGERQEREEAAARLLGEARSAEQVERDAALAAECIAGNLPGSGTNAMNAANGADSASNEGGKPQLQS